MKKWNTATVRAAKGVTKLGCVTAYDACFARLADEAGVPIVLVGDSQGMNVLGYGTTLPVNMSDTLAAVASVARATREAMVVGDMPFGSYQCGDDEAMKNAVLLMKAGAEAVKLEGGASVCPLIRRMTSAGIPVLAHVGMTPQSVNEYGGFKKQGKTREAAARILEDAKAVEAAGAFAVTLECVPPELAAEVTSALKIVTIGIGAGASCDAQWLVMHDLLGLNERVPSFAKKYADLASTVRTAFATYVNEVASGNFPKLIGRVAVCATVCAAMCGEGSVRLDISDDVARQTVIAEGGRTLPNGYQGHPTTVLTREGKLICVWTLGHGGPCGPAAESTDGGRTWKRIDDRFPKVYRETHQNCPTLQKCMRKDGRERLFVFSAKRRGDPNAPTNFVRLATMISDDGGQSWREGKVADLSSGMPPTGFMSLKDGSLALFGQVRLNLAVKTDKPQDDQGIWMSLSRDEGETWSPMRVVAQAKDRNLCEPCCLRSPDGRTLALLMRENRHRDCSMMCFSSDEGKTWSTPVLAAPELTGDRHEALALDDGRYLICFRDQMKKSPTAGQFVGWVGSWQDIVNARPGELRIRLLNHHGKKGVWPGNEFDTGYSGVEKLADGTILCTTYSKHWDDDRHSSVVATRLTLPLVR